MVKCVYGPDTGRLHGFVICDLSDVLCQTASEIVRCGRLFGKPWELRNTTWLQCRADQRMCQQTNHAGFVLCRSGHFRKRRFITSTAGTTSRFFRQSSTFRNERHTREEQTQQRAATSSTEFLAALQRHRTQNTERDARNSQRKQLWQITPAVTGHERKALISVAA